MTRMNPQGFALKY